MSTQEERDRAYFIRLAQQHDEIVKKNADDHPLPMLELKADGARWIGRCVALGIEVIADTSAEAGAALVAAVQLRSATAQREGDE